MRKPILLLGLTVLLTAGATYAGPVEFLTDLGRHLVLPLTTRFGAGIMSNAYKSFGPFEDGLGHCGWGGSLAIASPSRGLTCAYVMNRQSNILVGDPRAVRLVETVAGCP